MEKFRSLLLILNVSLIIACLLSGTVNAQVNEDWVARYNGPASDKDEAYSIAVDGSGNVYVTGYSSGSGTGFDYATIKYNSSGVQQWLARYNGPGNGDDYGNSITIDASGNVYVTGSSPGIGANTDYATIKYNSAGTQQWAVRYNGTGNDYDGAFSIAVDASGNVYVAGESKGNGMNYDYVTIKYNSSGLVQWAARYNGPGGSDDIGYSIALNGSGNVYVTGYSVGSGTGTDYATIKYNSAGFQQWAARYNGPGNVDDRALSLALDTSGNVYVTGYSGAGASNADYATIKYNSAGIQQWAARYNGTGNGDDGGYSIALDGSGNVYVTGFSLGSGTGFDCATIKYNSAGVQDWVRRYNGTGNSNDFGFSIAVDGSGNVYAAGSRKGIGTFDDYATIKYDVSGVQKWVQTYNGPGNNNDGANSIKVDNQGFVYVTGHSAGISGHFDDYATIRYSQPIGINIISSEIPKEFKLSQNYPNPFNPSTNIKFQIPKSEFVNMVEYDVLGRELATLVNEELKPGTYEVSWDASNYPSGVYFYEIKTSDNIEVKKMVLVK